MKQTPFSLVVAFVLCLPLVSTPVAQASVKLSRSDTAHGISGTSTKEIGRQLSQRDRMLATTFRHHIVFAVAGSVCYVKSARHVLTQAATHPRLDGKLPAEVRKRWDSVDSAVKAGREKTWQRAVQAAYAMDAATAHASMKGDPKCYRLKSLLSERLSAIEHQFKEQADRYGNQLNEPSGAIGKAAARFYELP